LGRRWPYSACLAALDSCARLGVAQCGCSHKVASCLSWFLSVAFEGLSGRKHQPTQLTRILPRLGQTLLLSPPFGARSAGTDGLIKSDAQAKHIRHQIQKPVEDAPPPPDAGCTKLLCTSYTRHFIGFCYSLEGSKLGVRVYGLILANPSPSPGSSNQPWASARDHQNTKIRARARDQAAQATTKGT
jgi:hypothetical protein